MTCRNQIRGSVNRRPVHLFLVAHVIVCRVTTWSLLPGWTTWSRLDLNNQTPHECCGSGHDGESRDDYVHWVGVCVSRLRERIDDA